MFRSVCKDSGGFPLVVFHSCVQFLPGSQIIALFPTLTISSIVPWACAMPTCSSLIVHIRLDRYGLTIQKPLTSFEELIQVRPQSLTSRLVWSCNHQNGFK